jgi:hypothetical protein
MREGKMLFPKDVEIERSREGMPTSSSEHGIQPLRRPKQNVPVVQVPASCFYTLTEFVAEAPVPHTHTHTRVIRPHLLDDVGQPHQGGIAFGRGDDRGPGLDDNALRALQPAPDLFRHL